MCVYLKLIFDFLESVFVLFFSIKILDNLNAKIMEDFVLFLYFIDQETNVLSSTVYLCVFQYFSQKLQAQKVHHNGTHQRQNNRTTMAK